ncbi:MAG: ferrochelatase [Myxococcota bacterium]|jgi:ferrochelatase|nr:ferrochelatase [Myxococcota bacterium]
MNIAVVLSSMGGPADEASVESYLVELMTDPMLMKLIWQEQTGPFIARRAAARSRAKHRQIGFGHGSRWSWAQAEGLAARLQRELPEHRFFPQLLCRYGEPKAEALCRWLREERIEHVFLVSMDPQFSCCTTGSALSALWQSWRAHPELSQVSWTLLTRWGDAPEVAQAWAARVDAAIDALEPAHRQDAVLVYSAHALPLAQLEKGDGYAHEVHATIAAIHSALRHPLPMHVAFQSARRGRWQRPSLQDVLLALCAQRPRALVLVPVSFGCEHSETLYDLDIEARSWLQGMVPRPNGLSQRASALLRALPGVRARGLSSDQSSGVEAASPWVRVSAPNDDAAHLDALARLLLTRFRAGSRAELQLAEPCHACTEALCTAYREGWGKTQEVHHE